MGPGTGYFANRLTGVCLRSLSWTAEQLTAFKNIVVLIGRYFPHKLIGPNISFVHFNNFCVLWTCFPWMLFVYEWQFLSSVPTELEISPSVPELSTILQHSQPLPIPTSDFVINTFAASYLNTHGLNNSCLKSLASTLVDLTFQSRALRSFSLNQLRNLSW